MAYLRSQGKELAAPRSVIVCYSPRLLDYVRDSMGAVLLGTFTYASLYALPATDGTVGVVGGFGIGAPAAAIVVEELTAMGTSRFISMGEAGSIDPGCDIGSIVLCTSAVRDEGVSHHYLAPDTYAYPDPALTQRLRDAFERSSLPYNEGPTWTIDAPYRETVDEAQHYQREGVVTVEMEAAAVFVVAQLRGVAAASAFVISDSLTELKWNPRFQSSNVVAGMRTLFSACLDALSD
ncbi:MAG: nucleoside phosphorylase [Actinomycetota bacterium]